MRGPAPEASQGTYPPSHQASSPYHTPVSPYLPPVPSYSSSSYTNSQEVITVEEEEEEEEPLGWAGELAIQLPRLPATITMTKVNQVHHRFKSYAFLLYLR